MSFKERLIELRKQNKLSQEVLANRLGVHQNVIGRYERGEAKPSIELASKLAGILGVSLDYLVGKIDTEINKDILSQLLTIQKLPEKDKEHILFTIEALLRDAKTRVAYSI
jgi:transcriptional regulator with XRE-family HTH domain